MPIERQLNAEFWRKRRSEFATYDLLEEHHTLLVRWYELSDNYKFKGSPESEHAFKAIADRAAQGLPKRPGREPWESWLDHLRCDERFYEIRSEGLDRYSKQGLREVLREGFAPVVEPVVSNSVLTERDCTEFPTGRKPGDPYTNVDFHSVTGEIKHVFEASAILCQELEFRAIAPSVTQGETTGTGLEKSSLELHSAAAIADRAERRQRVVNPILAKKHWKRGRWATAAGVGKNSVYCYLDGTRLKITVANRQALAEALDLDTDQLPD